MNWMISVPQDLSDKSLLAFFKGWRWDDDPPQVLTIDFRGASHIPLWAATLFGAYAVWLREVREKSVLIQYDRDTAAGRFLRRIGLTALFEGELPEASTADDRIFPLTRVYDGKGIATTVGSLMSLLDIGDEEIEDAVKYSLVELLRNVVQHSRSRIGGFVSACFLPKSGIVDVVVADIGCGILSALREAYPEITTHQKAVRFSMNPHVSGTFGSGMYGSMKDNAGLGLFFIKEIASRSHGGFFLGSGRMLADVWGEEDGTQRKKYVEARTSGWRGTFALIQFRKDAIGEFGALLSVIRGIAAEARKDRSQLSVDFLEDPLEVEGLTTVTIKNFEEDVEAAASARDEVILPSLLRGDLVLLDFTGVRAATQSFVHALMYKVFRDGKNLESCLSVCCADRATEEAIRAVSAYARTGEGGHSSVGV